jgi:type IV fimbrial biogenesis protein FimT
MRALPRPQASGVTLLELLIAVGVVAVLAAVAIPQVRSAREAMRSGVAQAAFRDSLLVGVRRAAVHGSEVVLCPALAHGCLPTNVWTRGWIVFADGDGDRVRDLGEPVLKRVPAAGGGVRIRSSAGRTRIVLQPNGGNSGSNATFTFCDARGPEKAVSLVLANDGRLRSGPATPADATACLTGS